jgi:hypothetical protein
MEEWKQIEGYNYQVSSLGNIKSLNYRMTGKPQNLKPYINKQSGYRYVALNKDGVATMCCVGPLVNTAFNLKPDGIITTTDHINRDRTDDRASNLRWATWSEQNINQGKKPNKTGEKHIHPNGDGFQFVFCRDNKVFTKYFRSLDEATAFRDSFIAP